MPPPYFFHKIKNSLLQQVSKTVVTLSSFLVTKSGISLITIFASYVESPGNGAEKKEKVKQMIKDALPDEEWKIDPEFFDFILDALIDLVVMFLNKGLWKTAMKVLVK